MSVELENLLAKKFIARQDVKAQQLESGGYFPVRQHRLSDCENCPHYIPWKRDDLTAHLAGLATYGHYLVGTDDKVKLLAFDIDLDKEGILPIFYGDEGWEAYTTVPDLRAAWLDRGNIARPYMKMQFNQIAQMLVRAIEDKLGLQCAVAYSGNKGIHVYAFLYEPTLAEDAREGAAAVFEHLGCFEATKGDNFFRHSNKDPDTGFPNLSIELFPKQGSLDGKELGNLMRLPLGRNLKTNDPTFFMDFSGPVNEFTVRDSLVALSGELSLWTRPGE